METLEQITEWCKEYYSKVKSEEWAQYNDFESESKAIFDYLTEHQPQTKIKSRKSRCRLDDCVYPDKSCPWCEYYIKDSVDQPQTEQPGIPKDLICPSCNKVHLPWTPVCDVKEQSEFKTADQILIDKGWSIMTHKEGAEVVRKAFIKPVIEAMEQYRSQGMPVVTDEEIKEFIESQEYYIGGSEPEKIIAQGIMQAMKQGINIGAKWMRKKLTGK